MPLTKCPICDGTGEIYVDPSGDGYYEYINCAYCNGTGLVESIDEIVVYNDGGDE